MVMRSMCLQGNNIAISPGIDYQYHVQAVITEMNSPQKSIHHSALKFRIYQLVQVLIISTMFKLWSLKRVHHRKLFITVSLSKLLQIDFSTNYRELVIQGLVPWMVFHLFFKFNGNISNWIQGSTQSFLAGCPKSHLLGWYRNFLVYWYLKLDNQVVNSTCPRDKLGWIWRADDP